MKYLWYDSSCFCYGILYCCDDELFGVNKRKSISYYLFGKIINHCSKIEVGSLKNNMSEVTPPDNMRSYRTDGFEIVRYNGCDRESILSTDSDLFSMHILLFLVSWLDEVSGFLLLCNNTKLLHEASCFFHTESERPPNTSMSIPGMFLVNILQRVLQFCISK